MMAAVQSRFLSYSARPMPGSARTGGGVKFGSGLPQPVFESPMVVSNLPPFNAQDPQTVALYKTLLEKAQTFAQPQVSGRRVGALVIGQSGKAYLGANIEIKGGAPADTIHAEAFALTLARQHGEKGVQAMVQTLQPCGGCRQVMAEVGNTQMPVHVLDLQTNAVRTETSGSLFPFGYSYGSPTMNIYNPPALKLALGQLNHKANPLDWAALKGAEQSYLPNPGRKSWAGLAARLKDGRQVIGNVTSISGPNPTITPMQDLMIRLASQGIPFSELSSVSLAEPKDADYSFYRGTAAMLEQLAPQATLSRIEIRA